MIVIKNLTKNYGQETKLNNKQNINQNISVLKNINLTIENNSFTALLGRSGSGKTTLMNIIGCLDKASSGEYYLDNQNIHNIDINHLAIIRNKYIGFVFQQFYLLPHLTALENTALPLFYRGMNITDRLDKARELLIKLELGDRMNHKPNELSGGQQQRVAIARAIITDPKIILADEPTGNLDSTTGLYIMSLFRELYNLGKTIIIITHDHDIAKQADQMINLVDGVII